MIGVLVTILIISGLGVVPPILMGLLVDDAIAHKEIAQLTILGLGMILVPVISALVGVAQRWWSSNVGEGIIFDLRRELYTHLQGMSLRFFTATKTGELMSRLNSDVEGAQSGITGTFVSIVSNIVSGGHHPGRDDPARLAADPSRRRRAPSVHRPARGWAGCCDG